MNKKQIRLGVNIDHVATLREARGTIYPDPAQAAMLAQQAGADLITLHLREDRRHIQDRDVDLIQQILQVPMNLEMAATEDMLTFAEAVRPEFVCLVPEKREELTTEGGLDVIASSSKIKAACSQLAAVGVQVSLFIDPEVEQLDAAVECGASIVELHTGNYADADSIAEQKQQLLRFIKAAEYAAQQNLSVHGGHGLHYHNVETIAAIPEVEELNIGHSIIARSIFTGLESAVKEMKTLMRAARKD